MWKWKINSIFLEHYFISDNIIRVPSRSVWISHIVIKWIIFEERGIISICDFLACGPDYNLTCHFDFNPPITRLFSSIVNLTLFPSGRMDGYLGTDSQRVHKFFFFDSLNLNSRALHNYVFKFVSDLSLFFLIASISFFGLNGFYLRTTQLDLLTTQVGYEIHHSLRIF